MGGGEDVTYYNPGTINLKDTNPEAFKEVDFLRNLREQYKGDVMNALNPGNYSERAGHDIINAQTRIQNQYAQAGLANSSASFGAQNEAVNSINRSYDEQRVNDLLRSLQTEAALSGQISNGIYGIQNQFSNTQNQYNQAIQQDNANQAALWGSIIGAAGTVAGAAVGGPAGAMAGASLFGGMAGGGGGGYSPPASPSPSYAPSGYSVGNAYGMYGGY